jgi:hypothetical protein
MIANDKIRFYLDPLQSPHHTGTKMLVFRERYPRSYDSCAGKTVPVIRRHVESHHLWWVHEDGRYVDGAIESPQELQSYTPVLGIVDDEVFVVGNAYGRTADDRMIVRDAVRSDGKIMPGRDTARPATVVVDRWYQAAPWARECMPEPGDDQSVVNLLVAVAEQRFKLRLGEICILREANDRDWREDLEDLDYALPTPQYAVVATGSMYIPVGTTTAAENMAADAKALLDNVTAKSFTRTPPSTFSTRVEVPVQMVLQTSFEKYESVDEVNDYSLRSAATQQLGVYDAALGSFSKIPVLRYAS